MTRTAPPARPGRWARLRLALRPPRRLRPKRSGLILIAGVLSLGLATLNTGNNLLYLLVGALLGLITLSGWLSEQSLSGIHILRRAPFGATAGRPFRIEYRVQNRRRRLPTAALELRDAELVRAGSRVRPHVEEPAYLGLVAAGGVGEAAAVLTVPRRGVYDFDRLVLATSYPFGLFTKERDLAYPGTLLVWPRSDLPVPALPAGGSGRGWRAPLPGSQPGPGRGEYRSLRSYRPGDDPRDIHWRTTARRAEPIVREYDRDRGECWWIVLDLAAPDETSGEAAVELAASVAADAAGRGVRFGFAAGHAVLPPPSAGETRLEPVLDLLAQVELGTAALRLPAAPGDCILVTARAVPAHAFGAVIRAGETPGGGGA